MPMFNKFHAFVEHLAEGVHNLQSHTLKVMLTNAVPSASAHSVKADLAEIAAGNGYVAGGPAVTVTSSAQTGGVYRLFASNVTITASGGPIGPFRCAVLYNDTPTSPADPLIGWWDYGASITLLNGETLTLTFDAVNGVLQLS